MTHGVLDAAPGTIAGGQVLAGVQHLELVGQLLGGRHSINELRGLLGGHRQLRGGAIEVGLWRGRTEDDEDIMAEPHCGGGHRVIGAEDVLRLLVPDTQGSIDADL